MAEWDGKEESCSCDCGFDIPNGGTLNYLNLSMRPLGVYSGGTGARTTTDARHVLGFFAGKTDAVTISATSPKTVNITFDVEFAAVPNVIVTPQCSAVAGESYGIFFYILSVTETGCSVRLTTNYSGTLSVAVQWLAIGNH